MFTKVDPRNCIDAGRGDEYNLNMCKICCDIRPNKMKLQCGDELCIQCFFQYLN